MSFTIKSIAFLDMCTAVVVCIFQIAALARYPQSKLEQVAAGIWCSISFFITGWLFWRNASSSKKKMARVYNYWELTSALISFFLAIVLTGIMAARIQEITKEDWYCVYRFVHKEYCDVEKALAGVMLFGGVLAMILNGALTFISCYCYE